MSVRSALVRVRWNDIPVRRDDSFTDRSSGYAGEAAWTFGSICVTSLPCSNACRHTAAPGRSANSVERGRAGGGIGSTRIRCSGRCWCWRAAPAPCATGAAPSAPSEAARDLGQRKGAGQVVIESESVLDGARRKRCLEQPATRTSGAEDTQDFAADFVRSLRTAGAR